MADRTNEVARYYDRNTRRFLTFGRGRRSRAIHRELWGPGVSTPDEALAYADELVAELIRDRLPGDKPVIVDMGCGVGGTLFHLAGHFPEAKLLGITVSGAQQEIGERLMREQGLGDRCRIELGDFQRSQGGNDVGLVLAIESLGHAESSSSFLAAAASHLRRGGFLVVLDDFVAAGAEQVVEIETFRRGWRLPSLSTAEDLVEAAARHGLGVTDDVDLSALVPLSRPRDRAIAAMAPVFERLGLLRAPFFANMIGGNALRRGLQRGSIEYRMIVFENEAGRDA